MTTYDVMCNLSADRGGVPGIVKQRKPGNAATSFVPNSATRLEWTL